MTTARPVGADIIRPLAPWGATTRRAVRRGDLWSPVICWGIPRGRAAFLKVASLDFYRKRPRRLRRGGRPHFFPKKWGKRRAGGLRPPWTPQYGGSWRRWAVQTGQRPAVHCRPFPWHLCYRRCRASGGTHRDYPASPESCCAVPTWPAGPPSVPCLRKTLVVVVIISVGATCGRPPRAEGALQRKPPRPVCYL